MNEGNYGYPKTPNKPIRIEPPKWRNYKMILSTTSSEIVPQNVHQMLVMVFGGGGNGGVGKSGGGGGGFAQAIIDVIPGQLLPTITIGAAAGTTSFGSMLTATGGATSP